MDAAGQQAAPLRPAGPDNVPCAHHHSFLSASPGAEAHNTLPRGAISRVLAGTKRAKPGTADARRRPALRATPAPSPSWPLRNRATDRLLGSFRPPVTVPRRCSRSDLSNQWHSHHRVAAAFTNKPPLPPRRPEPRLLDWPRPALLR